MADYTDYFTPIFDGYMQRLRYCLKDDFLLRSGENVALLAERVSDNEANNKKGFDYYIILKGSTFGEIQGLAMNTGEWQTIDWTIRVELYVRYIEAEEQRVRFVPFRSAVIYHTLNRRFLKAETIEAVALPEVPYIERIRSITPAEDVTYWRFMNSAPTMPPHFIFQPLSVVVRSKVRF